MRSSGGRASSPRANSKPKRLPTACPWRTAGLNRCALMYSSRRSAIQGGTPDRGHSTPSTRPSALMNTQTRVRMSGTTTPFSASSKSSASKGTGGASTSLSDQNSPMLPATPGSAWALAVSRPTGDLTIADCTGSASKGEARTTPSTSTASPKGNRTTNLRTVLNEVVSACFPANRNHPTTPATCSRIETAAAHTKFIRRTFTRPQGRSPYFRRRPGWALIRCSATQRRPSEGCQSAAQPDDNGHMIVSIAKPQSIHASGSVKTCLEYVAARMLRRTSLVTPNHPSVQALSKSTKSHPDCNKR